MNLRKDHYRSLGPPPAPRRAAPLSCTTAQGRPACLLTGARRRGDGPDPFPCHAAGGASGWTVSPEDPGQGSRAGRSGPDGKQPPRSGYLPSPAGALPGEVQRAGVRPPAAPTEFLCLLSPTLTSRRSTPGPQRLGGSAADCCPARALPRTSEYSSERWITRLVCR